MPGMTLSLDHLVVTAGTLDEGVGWCESTFGVTPGPGGRHALMGTHNRLLNISGAGFAQAYLEIIAIDPDAPRPFHVRWFGLDARRAESPPMLTHLVLRCADMHTARAALLAAGQDPGTPTAASRDTAHGLLQWLISVREDGAVLADRAPPTLIQWPGPHPSTHMPDSGLILQALSLPRDAVVLPVEGTILTPGRVMTAILRGSRGDISLHTP